jgi:hypothetical protein
MRSKSLGPILGRAIGNRFPVAPRSIGRLQIVMRFDLLDGTERQRITYWAVRR